MGGEGSWRGRAGAASDRCSLRVRLSSEAHERTHHADRFDHNLPEDNGCLDSDTSRAHYAQDSKDLR